jgi:hypothetical protein
MAPLPPLPPLPSLWGTKKKRRLLSWATVLTVAGAIGVGIFHGVGRKIFDAVWPHLQAVLPFH